ncbi:MAG: hypothetical protein O3B75_01640 [Planctomycetota bacterium]|nr:hypothetical protein [Planctomycetota bacterium]
MSSYVQLVLGLRSLAIKIVVFVVLAGIFAWFIGGSIFPGSQVVNSPAFQWQGFKWHAQVTGNGRAPSAVQWRLIRVDEKDNETVADLSVTGIWRNLQGPLIQNETMMFGIESEQKNITTWWSAQVDSQGRISTHQWNNAQELFAALAGLPSIATTDLPPAVAAPSATSQ